MNLRCVFHVSANHASTPSGEPVRAPMPSMLDLDVEWVDEPRPRGTSIETWTRARGWASED